MAKVKVRIYEDSMGNISGYPIRDDLRRKIARHLAEMNVTSDSQFFFQEGGQAGEFLGQELKGWQAHDLRTYGAITILIDPWIMGHFYGWDTHTLFE